MIKRCLAVLAVFALASSLSLMAAGKEGTWTGIVTDKMCAVKGANLTDADCAKKCVSMGSSWALYESATKKVYVLAPADKVEAHAGHTVVIKGTMDGDTITVTSVTMAKAS
jgi:hypothetical protein